MFSLSGNQYQTLLPSLQHVTTVANTLFRTNYTVARSARRTASKVLTQGRGASQVLCEESLHNAARVLKEIPSAQLQALIQQSEELLPRLVPAILKGNAKPSHWRQQPVTSSNTFFENLNGFSQASLAEQHASSRVPKTLLRPVSQQLQFARGFKSRRIIENDVGVPFQRMRRDGAGPLKQHLPPTGQREGEKMDPKHYFYFYEGYKAGQNRGGSPLPPDPFMSDVAGKLNSSASAKGRIGGSGGGSGFNIWDKINKMASVLIMVAILISLTQVFNIPVFRVNRGGNGIAPEDIGVTFDDVKGCDEAKQELQELVEFLMNPEKFSALGGKLPKGCLLVGPPGTGKTLLARAVAGQAGVPFFHAAGSEFDEVLVGQGARRVRDLFRSAKARAPCVIFIDEIDSVGSKRTSSVLHPYANQTINQLLSEMDGFLSNEGVIVIGATNRAEDLDKALLRPGRFDTQVMVPTPDMKGRKEILRLYLGKIKHDMSVDLEKLAKMTVGFSGADLENMVNTAAIRAAVEGKDWVTMAEFEYSHDKHVLGTDWKSRVRDKDDLRITAYHEAGHTLVAYFTNDSQPLHKVTIVAKGASGGHTAFLPERDAQHETKSQFLASMDVAMGGRAAEELIFGKDKVTGGASSDLMQATNVAEVMVKRLGMSEKLGLRVIPESEGLAGKNSDLGPGTAELIDSEVNRFLNDAYKRAMTILRAHRKELDVLADALLNYETLDADDIKAIIEGDGKPFTQPSNKLPVISIKSNQSPVKGGAKQQKPNVGPNGEILVS